MRRHRRKELLLVTAIGAVLLWSAVARAAVEERVELPTTAGQFWATVILDGSPASDKLVAALAVSSVRHVLDQTRLKVRRSSDEFYVKNLRPVVGDPPVFLLQDPDGQVVYKASGANAPQSVDELLAGVRWGIECWRHRHEEEPEPAPDVDVDIGVEVPDVTPPEKPPDNSVPWWVFAVASVAGLFGGAAIGFFTDQ